ncbi:DUF3717 domain-containing protein [Duganella levis]|uniref:DUF3717 domain-containing protein n=1 Tax=Duganella levis TaxID=2692169 RepID=UPI00136F26AD
MQFEAFVDRQLRAQPPGRPLTAELQALATVYGQAIVRHERRVALAALPEAVRVEVAAWLAQLAAEADGDDVSADAGAWGRREDYG